MKTVMAVAGFVLLASAAVADVPRGSVAPAIAPPRQARPMAETEARQWQATYYLHPDPERVIDYIAYARRQGMLGQGARSYNLRGFLAGVFERYPARVRDWVDSVQMPSKAEQDTLIIAAWMAGPNASREVLARIGAARRAELFEGGPQSRPPQRIILVRINSIQDLDLHWGHFFATGDQADLDAVVRAIDPDPAALDRFNSIPTAARQSLIANARQPDVRLRLQRALRSAGPNAAALEHILQSSAVARP